MTFFIKHLVTEEVNVLQRQRGIFRTDVSELNERMEIECCHSSLLSLSVPLDPNSSMAIPRLTYSVLWPIL